ncbi:peptide-methionine (S)-S-oxide reductase MsrA [Dermatophilus congolensis]|uniref:peptide-methionine (S)-S-oxide reductase MsrA n=1 Tax=Dermatophilus congolensis TaxID=1863 RepID=UPI001AAEE074|nr:peptide-methionine (S)-S-oxide reductase MsrA [Dermatophilus congolensis]MBO3143266.1 peptide-methionine (S)-S-oxide reductase MsrA [Dermatophilus congolensis]MBO3152253.1 peptide-methionine (S)-S-oxide reductase MsrA [Dermatophilus congolensis]MBO3160735.1 peptide-methionine (S)-S-oxide reductase MsrA [Dermatophilus congolensis]MBO3163541.1 peptide-methionine (S)-S-oxide reductase MsrA [Dermatophilus congolensis]MBO3177087.1 peptide-methionine (S)-S-oxide reductase MsrA [Dermatophilus cong
MFESFFARPVTVVSAEHALPGRTSPLPDIPEHNVVTGTSMHAFPAGTEVIYLAMGCFWGVERIFWKLPGVITTAVGYAGGYTPNPTYEETCTGRTGHTETVLVAYDPTATTPIELLTVFWENHNPTTANQQGNDVGTQYRSAIYWTTEEQRNAALRTRAAFQHELDRADAGLATTEIRPFASTNNDNAPAPIDDPHDYPATGFDGPAGPFYYAEEYHQQYLHKNPAGYCNHGPNGFTCRVEN